MPGMDRKGPEGKGPMTGRKMGQCSTGVPQVRGFGRGFGMGRGRGFGNRVNNFGNQEPSALSTEEQKKILKDGLDQINAEKTQIEKQLKELEQ